MTDNEESISESGRGERTGSKERLDRRYPRTRTRIESIVGRVAFGIIVLSITAVQPALAQNAVCAATGLPTLISGFFQLTTGIGLIGAVVVWQANALADLFTLDRDQRESLKRYKRRALKSAVVLVVLGPLYSVAGAMMGLPLATCVDLTPL
jgi:hypothetical protein